MSNEKGKNDVVEDKTTEQEVSNTEIVGTTEVIDNDKVPNNNNHQVEIMRSNPSEVFESNERFSTLPSVQDNFNMLSKTANSLDNMKAIAKELIGSQLCPLKKESDIVLAIITGNQYGFPFMTSINNIYPVNGKPSMSAHLIRALLIQNKVIFKKTHNFADVHQFAKVVDGKWATKTVGDKQVPVLLNIGTIEEQPIDGKPFKVVDKVTRYTFTREVRLNSGKYDTLEATSEFRMSEAVQAGLADKDNWVKHPARMLDARAFTIGAREIAPDVLLGIYSLNELADDNNIKYNISQSLEESVVQ